MQDAFIKKNADKHLLFINAVEKASSKKLVDNITFAEIDVITHRYFFGLKLSAIKNNA